MPPQKYFFTDATDRMIRDAYTSPDINRRGGTVTALSRKLGIPRAILLRRARRIGLNPRVVDCGREWAPEEDAILEANAWKCPEVISKHLARAGYRRSANAIELRRKRTHGLGRREAMTEAGVYTLSEAAELMGCQPRFLASLIEKKLLPATMEGTRSDGRASQWLLRDRDIRKVIINYTANLNFARIDKFWLVDVLTGSSRAKQE